MPDFGFCGTGLFEYAQLMNEEFWKEICELDFNVSRSSPLELRLTDSEDLLSISDASHVSSIPLHFSREDGRFKALVTSM
jgi:hypothetical protein